MQMQHEPGIRAVGADMKEERMNISLLPLGKLPPGRAVSPGRLCWQVSPEDRSAHRTLGQGLCGGAGERQQEAQGWPTEPAGHGTGSAGVWTEAGEKGQGGMSHLQTSTNSGTRSSGQGSRRLRAATSAAKRQVGQPAADLRDIFGGLATSDSVHGSGKMSELGLTVVLSTRLLTRAQGRDRRGDLLPHWSCGQVFLQLSSINCISWRAATVFQIFL